MNIFIECIGYPGSGKTIYSKKLKNYLDKKKIKLIKTDKYFFDYYSSGIINKIIYKNYYQYKKKTKFESKFIFRNQYKHLKSRLNLLIKKNKLKFLINNFNSLLDFTDLDVISKKTALDNFKIDLCTFFLDRKKKNYLIYNDEGLIQKVYQLYKKNIKISRLEKVINKYINSIPLPNILIIIDTNFNNSVKNSERRRSGFKYNIDNILETKKIFKQIDLILKKKLKYKTNLFIIKNTRQLDKKLKNIKNYL